MPPILFSLLQFLFGFLFLVGGAEFLIRGASRLAAQLRVPPVVVALTVVAFGTSMPELTVSVMANLRGSGASDIAIGNVVGSNIANLGLILGLCGLVATLTVHPQIMRTEFPLLIGVSVAFSLLTLDGQVGRWEGLVLVLGLLGFLVWSYVAVRQQQELAAIARENLVIAESVDEAIARPSQQPWFDGLLVLMGIGGLVLGADWLVQAASTIARTLGVSELVIGLTLVAVGTSLPEAATSLVAVFRHEGDIAIGNVVGSNLFNILGIVGISALIKPLAVPDAIITDLMVMVLFTVVVFAMVFRPLHSLRQWMAGLLLAGYLVYAVLLFL